MTDALIAGSLPSAADYDADVVILSLDRVEETLQAVASALSQHSVRRHVLVFDQGSTAQNLERLRDAVSRNTGIALFSAERNWGVAGGRNRASRFGHGRVIVALDNDAEFADGRTVARAVERLAAEADLAALGFRIVIHDSGEDDLSSWGYPTGLLSRAAGSFEAITFVGAGHAISRQAWDACGGYDDSLFFCWEEFDFCLNAISKGWRVRYDGDLVIRHKVSPDRRFNWSGTRWFYYVRNRLYIGHKWQSWLSLAPRAIGYLLKGTRNGLMLQTLRAMPAAWRLSRGVAPHRMSSAGKAYLFRNDIDHRGGLMARMRREVFAALPGHGMKEARTAAKPLAR